MVGFEFVGSWKGICSLLIWANAKSTLSSKFKILVKIIRAPFSGSMLSKLRNAHRFCLSCSASEMMIFSSSSLILMLEVLFDYVFVEGGRWACSSEFVSIYKKHSWLNMCVLLGFLFIKSCFLWTGLWKRTVTLKNYTGEWSHLASAVKDKSFSVLSQWSLLSSHTQPKWCWFQHWELSENNSVQSPSAQVSVMLTPFSWVALCTKPFRVAAHHQTESLKGISF